MSKLELCLLILSILLLLLLGAISVFWLFYLDGYHIFREGIQAWKQRNPFFSPRNGSVGYDPSAGNFNGLVCTSKECANIAAFFANNMNEKVSLKLRK